MNKRIRKKYEVIDASGVKEIAEMQEYICQLEDFLWRMAMCIQGEDDCKSFLGFPHNTKIEVAADRIYEFITKHREKKDEK